MRVGVNREGAPGLRPAVARLEGTFAAAATFALHPRVQFGRWLCSGNASDVGLMDVVYGGDGAQSDAVHDEVRVTVAV